MKKTLKLVHAIDANKSRLNQRRCSITSIVITYVHHQIAALQYSIKGGAQGTRWQPSFEITRWL